MRDFHIHEEVAGQHFTGKQMLLDVVLVPRDPKPWKSQDVALGVEFKDAIRMRGDTKNFTKWLAQCIDYAHTRWDGFGFLPIFACPSLVEEVPCSPGSVSDVHRVLRAVMGQFLIGELTEHVRHGWSLVLHSRHRIWSLSRGVEEGRRYLLKPAFGSR
jgi:hypothetical protein